jgi:ABC-2 type transport system ATP-binding protein
MPALRARGLVKTYGRRAKEVRALDGLDLEVPAGTVLALLGPNGAGKSTAVRILTTLARPDAGSAEVAGLDVLAAPDAVRRRIGLVSQRPSSDPLATGRENLELAGRIQGLGRGEARDRATGLLAAFDLADAAGRRVGTWSGGMSRKLDVAIGLVHRPSVLFLDEPTTGLDPQARAELWAEVARLAVEDGVTVLLTTHYLDEADALAGEVAIVDHGRVVVQGPPQALKSELRGDAVHVELTDPAAVPGAAALLTRVGLREVTSERATVRGRADDAARAVPVVLAALEDAGVPVASVTLARPSLDDVYLRHVGRAYSATAPVDGAAGVAA